MSKSVSGSGTVVGMGPDGLKLHMVTLIERGSLVGNKLYVGNLAYSVRDQDLQDAFSQYGAVSSAKVMMDRDTGRSKGFGFVEMSNDAEAQAAINGLNGQPVAGRAIVVNEARPREERPAGFRSPYGGGNGGGSQGGGAQITEFGFEVLRRYRDIEAKADQAISQDIGGLLDMLSPHVDS